MKPFLKWAGSKRSLTPELLKRVPPHDRYFEPFFGGGSLFFALKPKRAFLGDSNLPLMLMYRAVARRPRAILKELRRHKKRHCPDHYYHVRDWFNQTPWTPGTDVTHAAAFIYLNKAAYSGIWRVNKSGHFNVPVAKTKNLSLPTNLVFHANALKRATIYDGFFWDDTLELADEGDFVYADPPYDGTYSSYTLEKFDDTEQVLLAKLLAKLADSGVKVLASNSDTPFIRRLYKSFTIERLPTRRRIGHKNVHELLMRKGY